MIFLKNSEDLITIFFFKFGIRLTFYDLELDVKLKIISNGLLFLNHLAINFQLMLNMFSFCNNALGLMIELNTYNQITEGSNENHRSQSRNKKNCVTVNQLIKISLLMGKVLCLNIPSRPS